MIKNRVGFEYLACMAVLLMGLAACMPQSASPGPGSPQPSQPTPAVQALPVSPSPQTSMTTTMAEPPTGRAEPPLSPEPAATDVPAACQPLVDTPAGFGELPPITLENAGELEAWLSLDLPGAEFRFSGNFAHLAVLLESQVQLYDMAQGRLVRCLQRDTEIGEFEFHFEFSADEASFVWTARRGVVERQEVAQEEGGRSLAVAEGCCQALTVSPDGRHVAVFELWDSEQTLLWDSVSDEVLRLDGMGVVFSPEGRFAAIGSYDEQPKVSLLDLSTKQVVYSEQPAFAPQFSPDGTQLVLQRWVESPEMFLIDLSALEIVRNYVGFDTAAPFFWATFSPDRQTLAWEARGTLQLMDAATGQLGPQLPYQLATFSADSRLMAVVSTGYYGGEDLGGVWVIDLQTGEEVYEFDHGDDVFHQPLDFSPDSRILATADQDDSLVRLWSMSTGAELQSLVVSGGLISRVEFSPSGRIIFVWTENGGVMVWAIPPA